MNIVVTVRDRYYCEGVPGVRLRPVLRAPVLRQQLHPRQAQHALRARGGTRRHGE